MTVIFTTIGVLSLIASAVLCYRRFLVLVFGEKVAGEIVDYVKRSDAENSYVHPIVEYVSKGGNVQSFTSVAGYDQK